MSLSNTNPIRRCFEGESGRLEWEAASLPDRSSREAAGQLEKPARVPGVVPPVSPDSIPAVTRPEQLTVAAGPALPPVPAPAATCDTNINIDEVRIHKTHAARYEFPVMESDEPEPYDPRSQYQMLEDIVDIFGMKFRRGEKDDMEGIVGRNLEESVSGPIFYETRRQLKAGNQLWKQKKGKLTEAEKKYFDRIEAKLELDENDEHNDKVARGEFFPKEPTKAELSGKEVLRKHAEVVEKKMSLQSARLKGAFERKKKQLSKNRKLTLDSAAAVKRSPGCHPAARPASPAAALGAGLPAGVVSGPVNPSRRSRRNKAKSTPLSPATKSSDIQLASIHASDVQPTITPRVPGEPRKIIECKLGNLDDLPFLSIKIGCKRYNNKALSSLLLWDSAATHSCIGWGMLEKMGITKDQIDTSVSFVLTTVSTARQSGCILGRICLDIELLDERGLIYTFQETFLVLVRDILRYPILGIAGQRKRRAAHFTGEYVYQNFVEFYSISCLTGEEEYQRFKVQSEVNQLSLPDLFNAVDINLCKSEQKIIEFIIKPEYSESPDRIEVSFENEQIKIPPQTVCIPPETVFEECSMFTCQIIVEGKEDCSVEQSALVLTGGERGGGGGVTCGYPAGRSSSSSSSSSGLQPAVIAAPQSPQPARSGPLHRQTPDAATEHGQQETVQVHAVSLHAKPPPQPGLREDDYVESEKTGEVMPPDWEEHYLTDQLAISFRDEEDFQRQLKTNQKGEFNTPNLSHLSPEDRRDAQMLFDLFPDALAPNKQSPGLFNQFKFRIPLAKMPKRDKVRTYTTQHLTAADKLIGELKEARIVEEVADPSPCNSPYQLVKKSSDTNVVGRSKADRHVMKMTQQSVETEEPKFRLVLDLRSVNDACAEFPPVATPKNEAIQEDLANCVCTVTDLVSSFFQQEIDERDRWIFAFCHRNKFMRLTRSPQGFLGSTWMQTIAHNVQYSEKAFEQFKREYDYLFDYFGVDINSYSAGNYRKQSFVHGDDNLKKSKDMKHSLLDLGFQLFSLERVGLRISGQKSQFCTRRFVFTGNTYSTMPGENFNVINQSRLKALLSYRLPHRGIAELSSRLSIMNYYSRWIPGYKILAAPLYALLKQENPVWKLHHTMAFNNIRLLLSLCSRLYFPRSDVMKVISTDASILAYSYMCFLCFLDPNTPEQERLQLVQTNSKLFTLFESKRPVLHKEISAFCFALKDLEHVISASTAPVVFLTDAASIIKISNSDHHSPVMLLASYLLSKWKHLIVQHQPGVLNLAADYATRLFSYHYLKMDKSCTAEYSELNYWIPQEMLPIGTQLSNPLLKHILETSPDRDKWNLDPRRSFPEYQEDMRLPEMFLQEVQQHQSPEESFISAIRRGFSCLDIERQHWREIAQPALRLTQAGFNKIFNSYKTQLLKDKLKDLPVYNVRMFYLKLTDQAKTGEKLSEEEPRYQALLANRVHEILNQAQGLAAVNGDQELAKLCAESHRAAGYKRKSEILKILENHLNDRYLHSDILIPSELDSERTVESGSEMAGDRDEPPARTNPVLYSPPSELSGEQSNPPTAAAQQPPLEDDSEPREFQAKAVHGVFIPICIGNNNNVIVDFTSDSLVIKAKDNFVLGPNQMLTFKIDTTVYVSCGRAPRYELKLDSPAVSSRLNHLVGLNSVYLKHLYCFSAAARQLPAGTTLLEMKNIYQIPNNPKKLEVRLIGVNCSSSASFVKEPRVIYKSQELVVDLSALCQATGAVMIHGIKAQPNRKDEVMQYNMGPPNLFVRPGQEYWDQTRREGENYQGISYQLDNEEEDDDPRKPAPSIFRPDRVRDSSGAVTDCRAGGRTGAGPRPTCAVTPGRPAPAASRSPASSLSATTESCQEEQLNEQVAVCLAQSGDIDEAGFKVRSDQLGDPAYRGPEVPDLRQADLHPHHPPDRNCLNQMVLLDTALGQGGKLDNRSLQLLQRSDKDVVDLLELCSKETNSDLCYVIIDNLLFKVATARVGNTSLQYNQLALPAWTARLILSDMHNKTEHDQQIYSSHFLPNAMCNKFLSLYFVPKFDLKSEVMEVFNRCYKCRIGRASSRKHRVNRIRNLQPTYLTNSIHYLDHAYLANSEGYKYCLVLCEYSSGFTCLFPQKSLSAKETLYAFRSMAALIGLPSAVVCDSASSFAKEFSSWLKVHNIVQYRSTPRRSQQLGLVERKIADVKVQLTKTIDTLQNKKDWIYALPSVAMYLNMKAINKGNPLNAYNLFYGAKHYVHQGSYVAGDGQEEQAERFREAVLEEKVAAGEESQRYNKPSQRFRKNQFVHRNFSKADRKVSAGTVNLSPSLPHTYQVLNSDSSGSVLQCLELDSGVFTFLHSDEVEAVNFVDILSIENSIHHRLASAWEKHKRKTSAVPGPQFKFFEGLNEFDESDTEGGDEERLRDVIEQDQLDGGEEESESVGREAATAEPDQLDSADSTGNTDSWAEESSSQQDGEPDRQLRKRGNSGKVESSEGYLRKKYKGEYLPLEDHQLLGAQDSDSDLPASLMEIEAEHLGDGEEEQLDIIKKTFSRKRDSAGSLQDGARNIIERPAQVEFVKRKKQKTEVSSPVRQSARIKGEKAPEVKLYYLDGRTRPTIDLSGYITGNKASPHINPKITTHKIRNPSQLNNSNQEEKIQLSDLGLSYYVWSVHQKPKRSALKKTHKRYRDGLTFNNQVLSFCETKPFYSNDYQGILSYSDLKTEQVVKQNEVVNENNLWVKEYYCGNQSLKGDLSVNEIKLFSSIISQSQPIDFSVYTKV